MDSQNAANKILDILDELSDDQVIDVLGAVINTSVQTNLETRKLVSIINSHIEVDFNKVSHTDKFRFILNIRNNNTDD